jgi:hypothetical protein
MLGKYQMSPKFTTVSWVFLVYLSNPFSLLDLQILPCTPLVVSSPFLSLVLCPPCHVSLLEPRYDPLIR